MIEPVMFVLGVVGTLALGGPVVSRIASPDSWRGWGRPASPAAVGPSKTHPTRAFTPLDLGPDPTHWPSERPWPESRLAPPEWPSKSWNDDHFGAHWRKGSADAARTPPRPPPRAADAAESGALGRAAPEANPTRPAPAAAPPARKGPPAKTAPKAKPAKPAPARSAPGRPAPAKPAAAPSDPTQPSASAAPEKGASAPAKAPPAAGATPAGKPPSGAELEALIDAYGLAGAVKQIMERTGWDFRTAAQYLAQNR